MLLGTLFKSLLNGKQGQCTIDVGGAKVTVTVTGDSVICHRVHFSTAYIETLLRGHAATLLSVKDENAIMLTSEIDSHEDAELTGYLCVASDKAVRV